MLAQMDLESNSGIQMIEDMCGFIQKIGENPLKLVRELTHSEMLQIRLHVAYCKQCTGILNKVLEKYDDKPNDDGTYKVYTTLN